MEKFLIYECYQALFFFSSIQILENILKSKKKPTATVVAFLKQPTEEKAEHSISVKEDFIFSSVKKKCACQVCHMQISK